MTSFMDIVIIDLKGNEYEINSIHTADIDRLYLVIKEEHEDYITRRKARELIDEVNRRFM